VEITEYTMANIVVAFESQKAGEVLGGHYLSFRCENSSSVKSRHSRHLVRF
jgi:hypothetical protein